MIVTCQFSGEADWKIITISTSDPWSGLLHDIPDVERYLPGTLESIREWFRTYKAFDGKPPNEFAFNGQFLSAAYAKSIVEHTHKSWKKLLLGKYENNTNTANSDLPHSGMTNLLAIPKGVEAFSIVGSPDNSIHKTH